MPFFVPCIQMYADADRHGHEGIMLLCMDPHGMQPIVIQDAVVDPLRGGTVLVSLLPLCGLAHDRRIEPDVPVRLGMDRATIVRGRADTVTVLDFSGFVRAAPFASMVGFVIAPVSHAVSGPAQWGALLIHPDGFRDPFGITMLGVEVDKRDDPPVSEELIGSIVIMCGVEADIFHGDVRRMPAEIVESGKEADGIMPSGAGNAEKEGQIQMLFPVMEGKRVKAVAEEMVVQVRIPSPVGIRIGETAEGRVVCWPAIGRGMGMEAGAIAGEGQVLRRNQPETEGGSDSGNEKKLLEDGFKIKRDVTAVYKVTGDFQGDAFAGLPDLLAFFARLFRLFAVFRLGEKPAAGVAGVVMGKPEPVHKVKIGAKGREGVRSAAHEGGKDGIRFQPFDPGRQAGGAAGFKKEEKQDERAQDLGLVDSGAPERRIKLLEEFHGLIQV